MRQILTVGRTGAVFRQDGKKKKKAILEKVPLELSPESEGGAGLVKSFGKNNLGRSIIVWLLISLCISSTDHH